MSQWMRLHYVRVLPLKSSQFGRAVVGKIAEVMLDENLQQVSEVPGGVSGDDALSMRDSRV